MRTKTPSHNVTYGTRYGETSGDCYCKATGGRSHHESQFPWLSQAHAAGGKDDTPPSVPFRDGEDVDDYEERLALADTWEAGFLCHLRFANAEEDVDAALMVAALAGIQNPYKDGPITLATSNN